MNSFQLVRTKSLLRKKLSQSLKKIDESRRRKKSAKIVRRFMKSPLFKKAKNILVYIALPEEVQTRSLVRKALNMKKHVFAPRVNLRGKKIEIYQIKNWFRDLHEGAFGILEPKAAKSRKGNVRDMDHIIVPGLGFDRTGARLGRGGGFYDRFLGKAGPVKKTGFAFREQIVKKIPVRRHDVRMDAIITD